MQYGIIVHYYIKTTGLWALRCPGMDKIMNKSKVLLIAFYNKKALGVRYIDAALRKDGNDVCTVFYKDFNSLHPSKTTKEELDLLKQTVSDYQPDLIGLSVMSSMYLETVDEVIELLSSSFNIPLVCGGAYASMFPDYFLQRKVPYVIRTDGENAICKLADAIKNNADTSSIPCLCYKNGDQTVINEIDGLLNDIDGYGIPSINIPNAIFIEDNKVVAGDPQLNTMSYEVIASRGCPFNCSYCCCSNLRKLLPKGVKGVRTRSVDSVIAELIEAKKQCKNIVFVHFYDEIFPNTPGWVDKFIVEYKKHINLPFTIWSHPKMIDEEVLKKLVSVGLTEVIMGIQSGSEHIRRDVFHRYETQEDIINSTKIIRQSKVFWCSYDFMLQHPFETIDDLKESYWLAKKMHGPYELQLHGLNFLPGTDIVPMAIEAGYYSNKEMNDIMYAPMDKQFGAYWQCKTTRESDLWYKMLFLLQFKPLRKKVVCFEQDPLAHADEIDKLYIKGQKEFRLRYLYKKSHIVAKRVKLKMFSK